MGARGKSGNRRLLCTALEDPIHWTAISGRLSPVPDPYHTVKDPQIHEASAVYYLEG